MNSWPRHPTVYEINAWVWLNELGRDEGLANFRERLSVLGLRLILDFVPNHMAIDHPWLTEHTERLVRGDEESLAREPRNYFRAGEGGRAGVFAHGRDPYFPGWI